MDTDKYLDDYDTTQENVAESYEADEIAKLSPVDDYGVDIQLKSSNGVTKWIKLNKNSFDAISELVFTLPTE